MYETQGLVEAGISVGVALLSAGSMYGILKTKMGDLERRVGRVERGDSSAFMRIENLVTLVESRLNNVNDSVEDIKADLKEFIKEVKEDMKKFAHRPH